VLREGRGDVLSRVVADEGQSGHARQPDHHECEHRDDHQPPTAFVRHPFRLSPRQIHPWIIGRPAQPLEGTSPALTNDTNNGLDTERSARSPPVLGATTLGRIDCDLRSKANKVTAPYRHQIRVRPPGGGPGSTERGPHIPLGIIPFRTWSGI